MLQKSSRPLYQSLSEGLSRFSQGDPSVLASDAEIHYSKVLNEQYVYMDFLGILHWEQRDCRLKVGEGTMMHSMVAPVFTNDSALTGFFSDM